ncbi:MAG: xanthine dehydrogenase family protein molybdopterin-binding subunit [Treponema sp.]|nr:xanthine dehydrogenase family protein molybdopterin-binding subunit [Treponema sp.]
MPEKSKTQISKSYYSDLEKEGMIFAKIIRSPKKTGILKGVEIKDLPEGYFLIDAKNFPGKNSIETLGLTTEIFCSEKILYEGQPLAILAGPNKKILDALSAKAKFDIEQSPSTAEKNVISQKRIVLGGGRQKNVQKIYSKGAFKVQNKWTYNLSTTQTNETNGALCYFLKDNLVINTPTQWPSHLIKNISAVFSIPEEKITINKTLSSEPSANSLWGNTLLCCQICAAAKESGKPVKLILSRDENEKFISNTGEVSITHKTAFDKDGLIQAALIDIDFDAGAFNPFAEEIIDRLTIASVGVYNFDNLEINAAAHSSQKAPASTNIETIDAQAFYAIESQLQKAADITGIDPGELRLINSKILSKESSKMPFNLNIEKAEESLNAILAQSDFKRKFITNKINSSFKSDNIKSRGIGLSTAYDASGYYGTSIFECNQKMEATLQKDGTLVIHAITPSKTILDIWKKEAAEILQIDQKMIKVNSEFDLKDEPLIPENFYSNLSIMTSLLKKCCQGIQTKRFRSPLPITVSKAITKTQIKQWNKSRFKGTPFNSTSFIALALELTIDDRIYKPEIKNIWVAVSAGKILAEKEAEIKIKFSIQKTLAELIENERLSAKNISIAFVQSELEPAQIGGLIKKALPAAFASALSQALNSDLRSIPLKENDIFKAAQEAIKKESAAKKEGSQ